MEKFLSTELATIINRDLMLISIAPRAMLSIFKISTLLEARTLIGLFGITKIINIWCSKSLKRLTGSSNWISNHLEDFKGYRSVTADCRKKE